MSLKAGASMRQTEVAVKPTFKTKALEDEGSNALVRLYRGALLLLCVYWPLQIKGYFVYSLVELPVFR